MARVAPQQGDAGASSAPTVLEARDITKRFGAFTANDHISISLRRGEVLGLLGENGAGKSTLMKILYGLYKLDEGSIAVDAQPVRIASPRDAVALGIGMVHQHFVLVPPLTVAENVVLGNEPRSGGKLDVERAVVQTEHLCRSYGLQVDPRARVADLSVGVQQRVEILKTLYRQARILILDEPTAVLTPQETNELFGVLRGLVEGGLSVILITHKLGELLGVSDRITVIRDGKVVRTVVTAETNEAELARLMVGREVVLRVDKQLVQVGPPRLEAAGLVVDSGTGAVAVNGVDLSVRGGEIVAVAGVDGNGQVELAEALAGTRRVRSGTVRLDGEDVTALHASERRVRGLAYVPEDRLHKGLVTDFSLTENLALKSYREPEFCRRGWLRLRTMRERAGQLVRTFDVRPPDPGARAGSLSGGNQQKVVIAREFSADPGVLVVAQPTRGVDVGAIEFIHARLLEQRAEGKAILLISLELDEILSLADRIAVLFKGRIVGETSAAEATEEQLGLWMAGR